MTLELEQIMDAHVQAVRLICKISVPPHGDIIPMIGVWAGDSLIETCIVELPPDRKGRRQQHERAMTYLKERQAEAYTFAGAFWGADLSQEEYENWDYGPVSEHPKRKESVICIAGDRNRTLTRDFDICRTSDGRIGHLKLRSDPPGVRIERIGIFHDLLLSVPHEQRQ